MTSYRCNSFRGRSRPAHEGVRRTSGSITCVVTIACVLPLTACAPTAKLPSPSDLRTELIDLAEDTAAQTDVDGWEIVDGGPTAQTCGSSKIRFVIGYLAPRPPEDHDRPGDAAKVAEYWAGLGYSTQVEGESSSRVVFGQGADITSVSFSTGPGTYGVIASTRCVPGNVEDYGG